MMGPLHNVVALIAADFRFALWSLNVSVHSAHRGAIGDRIRRPLDSTKMKFGKRYTEYVEKEGRRLLQGSSYVEFKRHKKLLKRCGRQELVKSLPVSRHPPNDKDSQILSECCLAPSSSKKCPSSCSVCDGNFFPNLLKEVSAVVGCFNSRAQQLLDFHLSSKFQRLLLRMKHNFAGDHRGMIQEGRSLVNYASMNAIAIRKILKKYDKVHCSVAGRAFRTRLQAMHAELLQSPWLIELSALYINLKDAKSSDSLSLPEGFADCSCHFENSKATLQCTLVDSQPFEVDLTCSVCLDILFDPVALGCGHLFCNSCACSAASIPTMQGVKSASQDSRCPLCRQTRVYLDAIFLCELNLLIRNRCKDYWEERQRKERVERVQQVKEHWDNQMKVVLGI